jgi:hypothetical protein
MYNYFSQDHPSARDARSLEILFIRLCCYPIDVVKARIQAHPVHRGFIETTKAIFYKEGWRAFGKGCFFV